MLSITRRGIVTLLVYVLEQGPGVANFDSVYLPRQRV